MSTPSKSDSKSDNAAFSVEERGIDLVPAEARQGKPIDMLWMWLGANMSVFYIVVGALVVYTGLSFAQAIIAIVLGNVAWVVLGFDSVQGPSTGTATYAVSRAAYGPKGGQGLSVLNWLTNVGFEASGLSVAVLAALALLKNAGVGSSSGLKIGLVLTGLVLMVIIPLYGHATILLVQRWVAYIAIPLLSIMGIMILTKVNLGSSKAGGWAAMSVAIALVMANGGLSANCGSDYSRYLPEDSSKTAVFWYSTLGGMLPSLLLSCLGAALASVIASGSDPIAGIPKALPSFVFVPYLLYVIISTLTGASWNLYSSGLSVQAAGVYLKRWHCVLLDAVICAVLGMIVVFSSSFNAYYSDFLSLLIVWLAPWGAIYVVDWLLRRGKYDATSLLAGREGIYWRRNGWHVPALYAQGLGMLATTLWINSPAFVGPLSSRFNHSDLSAFMGIATASLVYWLLARKSVPQEKPVDVPPVPVVNTPALVLPTRELVDG